MRHPPDHPGRRRGQFGVVILTALATSLMAPHMLRYAVRHSAVTAREKERKRLIVAG
ncbi:hypothetical protein AB0F17_02730 [Nonomuraea sp. NPDC026600]|uniref:hypothetical protein n=1 Tax=Nonomuraea sp. NPDC026600 TaxID=3155363 RepID=UPI0033E05E2F